MLRGNPVHHPDLRQDQPYLHHPQPLITYTTQPEDPTASAKDTAFLAIRAVLEKLSEAKGTGQAHHTPPSIKIKPMNYLLLFTLQVCPGSSRAWGKHN